MSFGSTQVAWKLAAELFGFGDIVDDVEAFDEFATFSRVAVTAEQIERWSLPPRPTKRTDSRSRKFDGESVELDAIPSSTLRELATNAIEQHVDQHQLKVLQTVEQEERRLLLQMAESFNGGGGSSAKPPEPRWSAPQGARPAAHGDRPPRPRAGRSAPQ